MHLESRTLEALDWPFVAEALASEARTPAGRAAAREVAFARDAAAIESAFDAIDEILALEQRGAGGPPVGGIEDIGELLTAAARGETLDLAELRACGSTLGALAALERFLVANAAAAPTLSRIGEAVRLDRRLVTGFADAFDERGELSEKTWPALGELRRRIASLERSMRATLESLLESAEYADLLQDRYVTVRGDRFVVPIKAQAKGLGLGIVHDASRTERTVFVEPAAIVPVGNERRITEAALRDEERRILAELSSRLGAHAGPLRAALAGATALDVAGARAALAGKLRAARPVVGSDGVVSLRHARHPVLALASDSVVPNDLCLDADTPVLVLTGPNAGGKTIAMKTIGLCALLVRAGCFVPAAPGSRVDVFDPVLADIGDMQTVHEGLSSFSAHLVTLREMLAAAGRGSLLMLDEIAAGTDPAQGGPLARAVIERLADAGARVVATTHYSQVKAMGADDPRVDVSALEYRDGRPTYRVVTGSVGESHALAAAVRAGLDGALIERARSLMESGERALHDALEALESERGRAADTAERLAATEHDLARREQALAAREQELRGRARDLEKKAAAALVDKLRAAEQEVRDALAELHRETNEQRAAATRAAIAKARAAAEQAVRDEAAPAREPKPGDRVRVVGLGVVGEVVSARDGELELRAGAMTVRAKNSDVEIVSGRSARHEARAAKARSAAAREEADAAPTPAVSEDWIETAMRSSTNTLDLRGARVEEGLERLQNFLDESLLENRDVVFVLHGHGTGAMKSAVRRALAASPYVAASAPATDDQGGDALTVSRLR